MNIHIYFLIFFFVNFYIIIVGIVAVGVTAAVDAISFRFVTHSPIYISFGKSPKRHNQTTSFWNETP